MTPKTKTQVKTEIKLVVTTPVMEEYWELSKQAGAIKKRMEEIKPEVTQALIKESHPLYTFSKAKTSVSICPFKIYTWVAGAKLANTKGDPLTPERLEELATHSLAPEALDLLFLEGYINEEDIPPECYETSGGHYIIRPKAK